MKKSITLFAITLIMIFSLISVTLAASYTLRITLKDAVSTRIQQGEKITLLIKLKDIDVGDGIGAISGKIEYDTSAFEELKATDIVACNGWGSISYNDQNSRKGEFVTERSAGDIVSEDNDLMEITFNVKKDANLGQKQIKITNISASDGSDDVAIPEVVAEITVVDADGNSVNNNVINNSVNGLVNNASNNSVNNVNNTSNNLLNSNANASGSANSDIPKTGVEDYFVPSILVLLVVAFASYIQYRKVRSL